MSKVERTTFLLKTGIECPCWTIEVASNCNCLENEFRPCGGKTDNRPSWCPLVEVFKRKQLKVWDEEASEPEAGY